MSARSLRARRETSFCSAVLGAKRPKPRARAATTPRASLAPLDQQFDQVLLEVDPETGELADVRILQPGGIQLEYRFGNWQENLPLPDSLFRFQAPPGVAIVDQPKQTDSSEQ